MEVTIEYCAECGFGPLAVNVAGLLLAEMEERIDRVTIVPSGEGAFEVSADGRVVYSRRRRGGHPDPEMVLAALRR